MVCFAVLAVVAIGFVYRFLPETKGLSVEQAVQVFEREAAGGRPGVRAGPSVGPSAGATPA
jgi:hypothetical protein